jgi:hypothetical protein
MHLDEPLPGDSSHDPFPMRSSHLRPALSSWARSGSSHSGERAIQHPSSSATPAPADRHHLNPEATDDEQPRARPGAAGAPPPLPSYAASSAASRRRRPLDHRQPHQLSPETRRRPSVAAPVRAKNRPKQEPGGTASNAACLQLNHAGPSTPRVETRRRSGRDHPTPDGRAENTAAFGKPLAPLVVLLADREPAQHVVWPRKPRPTPVRPPCALSEQPQRRRPVDRPATHIRPSVRPGRSPPVDEEPGPWSGRRAAFPRRRRGGVAGAARRRARRQDGQADTAGVGRTGTAPCLRHVRQGRGSSRSASTPDFPSASSARPLERPQGSALRAVCAGWHPDPRRSRRPDCGRRCQAVALAGGN